MNIFGTFKNLVAFSTLDSVKDLKQITKKIRGKLGKQKFLLSKYLSEIFEISNQVDIKLALQSADKISSKVLNNCYIIFGLEKEREPNKYFYLVENYINKNPIDIKNPHIIAKYYAAKILLNNTSVFASDFLKSVEGKFKRNSFSNLNYYYQEITKIIGEDRIEYLNDLLCETFFMCPVGTAFIGQIAMQCVKMLIYSDTSKQIFEFMLEE